MTETLVNFHGVMVSLDDARRLDFDRLVFGVGYVKPDADGVLRRVPAKDIRSVEQLREFGARRNPA